MFVGNLISEMHEGDRLLANACLLIEAARKSDLTVVYIQHCAYPGQVLVKGTDAWKIHQDIAPIEGDIIIEKNESSAFKGTELADVFRKGNIDTLIICGMQSEHCVANTSLSALELGFKVFVVNDCHSTFPSEQLAAKEIVDQQNSELEQKGANTVSVLELTNAITHERA